MVGAASWPLNILFLPFVLITFSGFILFVVVLCLGVDLRFWSWFGGVTISGVTKSKDLDHRRITDENDLKQILQLENDRLLILTRVETVRKFMSLRIDELKFVPGPGGDTNAGVFLKAPMYHAAGESKVENRSVDNEQSNSVLELFKYIPKQKILSLRSMRQRSAICKRKHQ